MYRILLVDDEILVRDAIRENIDWKAMDCELVGDCDNGKAAAEFVQNHPVDIVLTDILMPYMDGMELSRFLHDNYPDIVIVIFSGFGEFEYAKKAIQYGVSEYMLKPVTAMELRNVIGKMKEKVDQQRKEKEKLERLTQTSENYQKNAIVIRSRALQGFVDNIKTRQESLEELAALGIDLEAACYRVAVFELDLYSDGSQLTAEKRQESALMSFVLFNISDEIISKEKAGVAYQDGDNKVGALFMGNRTREFEQMELEFFCEPGTDMEWFQYWRGFCRDWLLSLGIKEDEMRLRDHSAEELCFYSKGTTDIEFLFPFGWGELWGIADRTDYDLTQHQNVSGQDMTYFDDTKGEKYIPYVIEPSLGADRVVLAFLCAAYDEENIGTEEKPDVRTVFHFHPALAPVKIGVLPLSKKLNEGAEKVYAQLAKKYNCEFDDRGTIGKRYRRQDEIGTPFCVTYDFDSEEDGAVTVRDRDTMQQERIKIDELDAYFEKKFEF